MTQKKQAWWLESGRERCSACGHLPVKSKRTRGKDIVETEERPGDDGKVVDIMEVLKKSLAASNKK